jgi:hypothetical protein
MDTRLQVGLVLALVVISSSCKEDGGPGGDGDVDSGGGGDVDAGGGVRLDSGPIPPGGVLDGLYTTAVAEIVVEIDYEPGAEPYTGSGLTSGDTWRLFGTNMNALFEAAPRTITYPTTLAGMEDIGAVAGEDHDVDAILALAAAHRDDPSTRARRTYYVVFLDGYFLDGGERRTGVLGVAIGGTGVIAMFKPVIAGTGALTTDTPRLVEQTTLVHELGHVLGFVNNGLPMVTEHQDEEHGAHCTNTDCVMYWQVEGTTAIVDFVTRRIGSSDVVLFGDECLDDARAAATPP